MGLEAHRGLSQIFSSRAENQFFSNPSLELKLGFSHPPTTSRYPRQHMIAALLRPSSLKHPHSSRSGLYLGKSWLSALVFSIVVSVIFSEIFSAIVQMSVWMGFTVFLVLLLCFMGIIVRASRRGETEAERLRQLAQLRSLQAYDYKDKDDF